MALCRSMSSFLLGLGRGNSISIPSLTQQAVSLRKGLIAAAASPLGSPGWTLSPHIVGEKKREERFGPLAGVFCTSSSLENSLGCGTKASTPQENPHICTPVASLP